MNAAISTEVRPEVSISTWNIDPAHSTAAIQGQAHDDLECERRIHFHQRDPRTG